MRNWILALLCLLSVPALAGEALNLDSLAGVYKHRFSNGDVSGETYQSEDILEVVALAPKTAYIRTHLEFYNGHLCSLSAVGHIEGDALVLRPHTSPDKQCELKLVVQHGQLRFDDSGDCRAYFCGARGGFVNEGFALSARRPIRYMDRLKASRQFLQALDEAHIAH